MPHGNGTPDTRIITGINVTPMVDVVLVLLVIVMVTATTIVAKTIPVDLPKSATSESVPTTLAISVDRDGHVYLDARKLADEELRARIHEARRADEGTRAVIAADGDATHRNVVRVIDVLRQEGVSRFAINVQPEVESPRVHPADGRQ